MGNASTTRDRYALLKKIAGVSSLASMEDLLVITKDTHAPYVVILNLVVNPSFTCGGSVAELDKGDYIFWRGCREGDNYVRHSLASGGEFKITKPFYYSWSIQSRLLILIWFHQKVPFL